MSLCALCVKHPIVLQWSVNMSGLIFPYQTVRDVDVTDKQILMRVDYSVPLGDDGSITDDFRIEASLPTIEYLLERGAKIVLISHLGRPDG